MDERTGRDREIAAACGVAATLALALWFASWTGDGSPAVWPADFIFTLSSSMPLALAWFLAACGYGWFFRKWLLRGSSDGGMLQAGLGVATMLVLDRALGALGVLDALGGVIAWAAIALGIVLLLAQLARSRLASNGQLEARLPHPIFWLAAPAIASLIVASCSAPGWLWASEFGGYDALSYHLQLPKEWLALGRIEPFEHNVYSFLPGYVEAAYYHLALLRGDAIESAYAAQMLHAIVTMAAACATGRLVWRLAGGGKGADQDWVAAMAGVVVLGTPWTIVAGSLAYNEMFVVLFLACAMLVAVQDGACVRKRGLAIGLLAGAAVGAKLTAVGFVVIPLAAFMMVMMKPRQWIMAGTFAAISCTVILLPYLIRNYAAAGNPVFPFWTELFGAAHWSPEQVQIWRDGHRSDLSIGGRIAEAWKQLLRFGYGAPPDSNEPWKPQWSILWWLSPVAAALIIARRLPSRIVWLFVTVLIAQFVFWLGFTHLQSRFLLPAVVPLAGLLALGPCALLPRDRHPRKIGRLVGGLLLFLALWPVQAALVFRTENGTAPAARVGAIALMTGELHAQALERATNEQERRDLLATAPPALYLNFLLPRDARTVLIGDAAPFYFGGNSSYQTTWDRGPMSEALRTNNALAHLRAQGFTHALVHLGMLDRWERAGWNDHLLTADRMLEVFDTDALLLAAWEEGAVRLYDIRRAE
jgi:4-amino-4-deoxy-L-arabinose transferase-like glycosyltransferase